MKARPSEIVNADQLFVGNQPSVGGHLEDMNYPVNGDIHNLAQCALMRLGYRKPLILVLGFHEES
jgi:hypothetical protein